MEDLFSMSRRLLQDDELLRLKMYKDTTGHWTIGWGHNLEAKGISKKVANLLLDEDLEEAINDCKEKIDFFDQLSVTHQYILVNMAFNMGIGGLLSFKRMLAHMKEGDFINAAKELENSLAFKEVPNRIFRLIKAM